MKRFETSTNVARRCGAQVSLLDDGAPDHKRLVKYNAWFTPQGAALQLCTLLRDWLGLHPSAICDPQAGAGVFGWAAGKVWPGVPREAVEIRAEEAGHLGHNYERHVIADYLTAPRQPDRADLIVTNPSFEDARCVAAAALDELRIGGWLGLLLRLTWGDAKPVSAWLQAHPPAAAIELDGRLAFAVGVNPATGKKYGEDSVTYRMLLWRRGGGRSGAAGIEYERYLKVHRLEDEDRTWLRVAGHPVRPGTEYLYAR